MKLQARKSLDSRAAVDHTPFAYHGAEVGAGGEQEPGVAGGGAPEGLPEPRNETEALPRRHGAGGHGG